MPPETLDEARDPDRGRYRFIDKQRYLSTSQLALERERLWPRVWHLAGLAADLANVGDYTTYELGNEGVLVVRHADGVKAFHNVCPHRGRVLCDPGRGKLVTIRCPYHHWEWETDGAMRRMPCATDFAQITSRDDVRLRELACEEWNGFVWVHFGESPPALATWLGSVGERLARYHPSEYRLRCDQTVELECNWKIAVDASNESYHIPAVHPELLQIYDEKDATEIVVDGAHAYGGAPFAIPSSNAKDRDVLNDWLRHLVVEAGLDPRAFEGRATEVRGAIQKSLRSRTDEFDFTDLSDPELTDYFSYYFFPNVHMNIQGLQLNISRARPHPTDPQRMWLDQWTFERPKRGSPARARPPHEAFAFGGGSLGFVTDQDTSTYIRVQRGLRSAGIERIVVGDRERRVRHMHETLDALLATPVD